MTFRRKENTGAKPVGDFSDGRHSEGQSALARAVALHLDGKRKEALKEIHDALDSGQQDAELYSARGHLHFEMPQGFGAGSNFFQPQ